MLKPFVDLGILDNNNRFSCQYEFTVSGRHLITEVTKDDGEEGCLDSWFFSKVAEAFNAGLSELSEDYEILHFVYESYSQLVSPLGFVTASF